MVGAPDGNSSCVLQGPRQAVSAPGG